MMYRCLWPGLKDLAGMALSRPAWSAAQTGLLGMVGLATSKPTRCNACL